MVWNCYKKPDPHIWYKLDINCINSDQLLNKSIEYEIYSYQTFNWKILSRSEDGFKCLVQHILLQSHYL